MGILIKAPTRRSDAGPQLAVAAAGEARDSLHIREVVRITGLRREQLYMWQRRYGFPNPARDGFGDRVYPQDQVARLKVIKQLSLGRLARRCGRAARRIRVAVDAGHRGRRPGAVAR